jgi:hypothetical protein
VGTEQLQSFIKCSSGRQTGRERLPVDFAQDWHRQAAVLVADLAIRAHGISAANGILQPGIQ